MVHLCRLAVLVMSLPQYWVIYLILAPIYTCATDCARVKFEVSSCTTLSGQEPGRTLLSRYSVTVKHCQLLVFLTLSILC